MPTYDVSRVDGRRRHLRAAGRSPSRSRRRPVRLERQLNSPAAVARWPANQPAEEAPKWSPFAPVVETWQDSGPDDAAVQPGRELARRHRSRSRRPLRRTSSRPPALETPTWSTPANPYTPAHDDLLSAPLPSWQAETVAPPSLSLVQPDPYAYQPAARTSRSSYQPRLEPEPRAVLGQLVLRVLLVVVQQLLGLPDLVRAGGPAPQPHPSLSPHPLRAPVAGPLGSRWTARRRSRPQCRGHRELLRAGAGRVRAGRLPDPVEAAAAGPVVRAGAVLHPGAHLHPGAGSHPGVQRGAHLPGARAHLRARADVPRVRRLLAATPSYETSYTSDYSSYVLHRSRRRTARTRTGPPTRRSRRTTLQLVLRLVVPSSSLQHPDGLQQRELRARRTARTTRRSRTPATTPPRGLQQQLLRAASQPRRLTEYHSPYSYEPGRAAGPRAARAGEGRLHHHSTPDPPAPSLGLTTTL